MVKYRALVFVLLSVSLLTGCMTQKESQSDIPQSCSLWTEYQQGQKCEIKIFKTTINSGNGPEELNLDSWDQIRLIILGKEVLMDGENVQVFTEKGENITFQNLRIPSGTYIIKKIDLKKGSFLKITYPKRNDVVEISAEFVRPVSTPTPTSVPQQ